MRKTYIVGRKSLIKNNQREYDSYISMLRRCYDKKFPPYKRYGEKGVKVCAAWAGYNGFTIFLKDMGKRPQNTTLDRIDNSGDYSPKNCRWATIDQQNRNRKTNIWYENNGELKILTDWARYFNLNPDTVLTRYHKGERGDKLFRPSQKQKYPYYPT